MWECGVWEPILYAWFLCQKTQYMLVFIHSAYVKTSIGTAAVIHVSVGSAGLLAVRAVRE